MSARQRSRLHVLRAPVVGGTLLTLALLPQVARTETATGKISGKVLLLANGKAKADAAGVVVYVVGYSEPPPAGVVPAVKQKDKTFEPALLAITAGQKVSFPNFDSFFHNVFSLSPARKFDLGQFKKGE